MTGSRQRKSAAEKAMEALAVARSRANAAEAKQNKLRVELDGAELDYKMAVLRRDYLAQSPDLPAAKP